MEQFQDHSFLSAPELLDKMNLYHQLYFNQSNKTRNRFPDDLANCTDLLEDFYYQQKLLYASEWFSINTRYSHPIPDVIKDLGKALIKKVNLDQIDNTYKNLTEKTILLFLLDDEQTNQVFALVKESLIKNIEQIATIEKTRLIKLLLNFTILQQTKGKSWEKEIFELYKLGLSNDSILHNGQMTPISFLNIVYQACSLQEFEWLDQFLLQIDGKLTVPNQAIYFLQAKGYIAFFQRRFPDCLKLISSIKMETPLEEVGRKSLQLRATFECFIQDRNYDSLMYAHLESYKKFLSRKEILTPEKKLPYHNFNKGVTTLVKGLEQPTPPTEWAALKKEIQELTPLHKNGKVWLLYHIQKQIEATHNG